MKNLKKVVCFILALSLCAAVFSGCGNNDEIGTLKPKETLEAIDFGEGNIIAKGKTVEISADTYGYFVYQCALTEAMKEDPKLENIENFDWDKENNEGVKIADIIKKNAANALIKRTVVVDYAKDNGIKLTVDEKESIDKAMKDYKEKQGEEMFTATLNSTGINNIDAYLELYEAETIYNKIKEDFDQNRDKYIEDEEEMEKYKDDENVCVKHILIKNDSEKFEDPKATAEEVLKKAKAGEDFDRLVEEYNEDPGAKKAGYSFGHGEMVPEFEEASFALDYGEISEIVETTYGYHIIKRYVGLAEFENYLVAKENVVKNNEYIDSISVKKILSSISEANKLLAGETEKGE